MTSEARALSSGGVSSPQRVIDSHNHSVNTGDSADTRSYYVGDILLRDEARGPAVIELEFDNQSLVSTPARRSARSTSSRAEHPPQVLAQRELT